MTFTTPQFVLFATLLAVVYLTLPRTTRKATLLVASYLFYAHWSPPFLLLLIGSTILDFFVGRELAHEQDPANRRRLLACSLAGNLGALGFFKYAGFFVQSTAAMLDSVGLAVSAPVLEIVLPVGISFYTFQSLSYSIDIYRRRIPPTESLLDFALFVAFFPQLVAGPIERAAHLLPQISKIGSLRPDTTGWGLIALGAFKKVVLADNLGLLVDQVYRDPAISSPLALWIGTYAFAAQIYCDFSGYSDIAVGLGRLMGLDIIQNFQAPYSARSPREFWQRWHISLSSWLRDYLYIPLGGNRHGSSRTMRNLAITMLLGGLWHGAAWTFVVWGAWHGALLVLYRLRPMVALVRLAETNVLWSALARLLFFHAVVLGWVLFRAQTLADAWLILCKMLDVAQWQPSVFWTQVRASGEGRYLVLDSILILAVFASQQGAPQGSHHWIARLWGAPWIVRAIFVVVLLYCSMLFAPESALPFIYFQF